LRRFALYSYGGAERFSGYRAPVRPALADGLALAAFVTVGLLAHDHALGAAGYARDALPLLAGWFAAAALFGLYRGGGRRALLATWAAGVTLGVVVRALALGRPFDAGEAAFLAVTLAFTGAFVLACRAVVRRTARAAP
jgi:Protein of unknown function (DUF3054)